MSLLVHILAAGPLVWLWMMALSVRVEIYPGSRSGFPDRAWLPYLSHPAPAVQARHSSRCKSAGAAPPQGRVARARSRGSARLRGTLATPETDCSLSQPTNRTGGRRLSVRTRPALLLHSPVGFLDQSLFRLEPKRKGDTTAVQPALAGLAFPVIEGRYVRVRKWLNSWT